MNKIRDDGWTLVEGMPDTHRVYPELAEGMR
jgi:hypothetical protein